MTTSTPYSCQTGEYTIDQLDGDWCARCGTQIKPGEKWHKAGTIAEFTLHAHVTCPKDGAK